MANRDFVDVNADVLIDEDTPDSLFRIASTIAKKLGSKDQISMVDPADFEKLEHDLMRKGIHPDFPLGKIDSWNGDGFRDYLYSRFGLVAPGSDELLRMTGELSHKIPEGYKQLHVEKDDYARHGVAIPIPGTDHFLCIATYDERPRWERIISHAKNRLLSALSGWDEEEVLPLQVVIRRTLQET